MKNNARLLRNVTITVATVTTALVVNDYWDLKTNFIAGVLLGGLLMLLWRSDSINKPLFQVPAA